MATGILTKDRRIIDRDVTTPLGSSTPSLDIMKCPGIVLSKDCMPLKVIPVHTHSVHLRSSHFISTSLFRCYSIMYN